MTRWLRIVVLLVAALLGGSENARATTYYFSGLMCQTGGGYTEHGLQSSGGIRDRATALCPTGGLPTNEISTTAATIVFDDMETAGDLACWWVAENWDGSLYYSSTLHSSGVYGGSPSFQVNWVGLGQLNWTNPINNGNILYPLNLVAECYMWGNEVLHSYNVTFK
jgi:hypothetical protein